MDIFISWSGGRSKMVAEALRDWIPNVIQAAKPWLSVADIDKGARWFTEISEKLEKISFGIICVTAENLFAPWLFFEAGALSKSKFIERSSVCPYLLGLRAGDIVGPLAQFQASEATKEDTLRLIESVNKAMKENALEPGKAKLAFDRWWPDLEDKLGEIPPAEEPPPPRPTMEEMLEEILSHVRSLTRSPEPPSPWPAHFKELVRAGLQRQRDFFEPRTAKDDLSFAEKITLLADSLNKPIKPKEGNAPDSGEG